METGLSKNPIDHLHHRAAARSAEFIEEQGATSLIFPRKQRLWPWLATQIPDTGLMMECGVWKGRSINAMARFHSNRTLYGFDSFEGLSESWVGVDLGAGAFDLKGQLPEVESNVVLTKGWVEDTLPPFFEKEQGEIAYLHVDTDTYSPARTILGLAKSRFKKGTIVLFDELIGYPFWEAGEYKALNEELDRDQYEYIAFSQMQAAIRIVG
ncbi:class I SAM-dependent methyltransferase [Ruegeria jejuensis]|uniref:class I SAM-dependent methyltransferase n=1 Tax=Ruegeria jejuensis TaxID=3233338 RepID=UPI00355AD44E